MSGILAEFIDRIVMMQKPTTIEKAGVYSDKRFEYVRPHYDRASQFTVNSLDSICKLVRKEVDCFDGFLFIRVSDFNRVTVHTTLLENMDRTVAYVAESDVPRFHSGYMGQADRIIQLRSLFIPNEDTNYLLNLLSKITDESNVSTTDNGVTQTVEAKRGISLKENVAIKPIVKLRPFRTFLEVEQPESEFLLRIREGGDVGLFEADGGVWELEAKQNIANYFEHELSDLIKERKVVVMV